MYIINPFYTIFNENNWFYNNDKKIISYSDINCSVNEVFLTLPLKEDNDDYNSKIFLFFEKFINSILDKIYNPKHKKIIYKFDKSIKSETILKFDTLVINDSTITLNFTYIHPSVIKY